MEISERAKQLCKNVLKSWSMWVGYVYIGIGALFDYMPAFRHALGGYYNRVFMATGVILILLRLKTKSKIMPPKE